MPAIELASAFVSLGADTRPLARDVRNAFGQAERDAGTSGNRMGRQMGRGVNRGLATQLGSNLHSIFTGLPMQNIGQQMGRSLADGVNRGTRGRGALEDLSRQVEQASTRLERARQREADAAGRVRIAEQQLNEARRDNLEGSSRITQAEEALARIEREHVVTQAQLTSATDNVTRSRATLTTQTRELERSERQHNNTLVTIGQTMDSVTNKLEGFTRRTQMAAGIFSGLAIAGGGAVASIGALTPVTIALGVALAGVGAAAGGAAVAGISAAGLAVATFKVGLFGLEDAFKNAFDPEKAEQFAEAMAKLSPQAQALVHGVRGLVQAWKDSGAQMAVQDSLLHGLGNRLTELRQYMPLVRDSMLTVADGFNEGAKSALNFVNSAMGARYLDVILSHSATTAGQFGSALGNLVPGLMAIASSAARVFGPLTAGIAGAARSLSDMLIAAESAGKIDQFFTRMIGVAHQVFMGLQQIVGILFAIGSAAHEANAITGVVDRLREMNAFLSAGQGREALVQFFRSTQAAAAALMPTLREILLIIGRDLAPIFSRFITEVGPNLAGFFRAVGQGLQTAGPQFQLLGIFASVLLAGLTPFVPLLVQLAPLIIVLAGALKVYNAAMAISVAATKLWLIVQKGIAALQWIAGVYQAAALYVTYYAQAHNMSALAATRAIIAEKAKAAATLVGTGITKAATAAQWLWNAALTANPIGIVIAAIAALVAGLVWFFTQTELGRQIWTNVWNGITTAISWAWSTIIQPIFGVLWQGMQMIGTAAMWLWQSVMVPAWNAIGMVIGWVWNSIIKPIWDAFVWYLQNILAPVMTWLWQTIIVPVWNAIGAAISWAWNSVIKPIWDGLVWYLQNILAPVMNWIWNNVIRPVWDAIGGFISWIWNNVIKPSWESMHAFVTKILVPMFQWLWNNIIRPIWDGIGSFIRGVIDNVIKPAFNGLKAGLKSVGDFFGSVVNGIKRVWDGLKRAVAVPVNFVIETVWNNGLRNAWNTVAKFLPGLKEAEPLRPVAFDRGGATNGQRGKDNIPALLGGDEHVFDRYNVDALGGQRNVYALRRMLDLGVPFSWDAVHGLSRAPKAVAESIATAPRGADMAGFLSTIGVPGYDRGGAPQIPRWQLQLAEGHKFAKGKDGNPYTWGNEDCSGYLSMIADKILGGPGQRRWATSSFPGGQPWQKGLGPGFSVGVKDDPGGPGGGHTAGTLGAAPGFGVVNVESGGSHGRVAYGGPAAGADSPTVQGSPGQFHLGIGADGAFMPGGPGGSGPTPGQMKDYLKNKVKEIVNAFANPVRRIIDDKVPPAPPEYYRMPRTAVDILADTMGNTAAGAVDFLDVGLRTVYDSAKGVISAAKNPGGVLAAGARGVIGAAESIGGAVGGLFRDQGGFIPNGLSIVRNETGRPEAVLNWDQLNQVIKTMETGKSLMDAVRALNLPEPTPEQVVSAKNIISANDTLDSLRAKMAPAAPVGATAKTLEQPMPAPQQQTGPAATTQQEKDLYAAKTTKEFLGSAGKIVGESLWDILVPSDAFPDPLELKDRYTIKPGDSQTTGTGTGTPQQQPMAVDPNQQIPVTPMDPATGKPLEQTTPFTAQVDPATGQPLQQPAPYGQVQPEGGPAFQAPLMQIDPATGAPVEPLPMESYDPSAAPPYQPEETPYGYVPPEYDESAGGGYTGPNVMGESNFSVTPDEVSPLPDLSAGLSGSGTGPGAENYTRDIARAAKDMGLTFDAAQIGVGTALVESELKMYANSNVPESMGFPHDAVGSDHDSVGLFQQRGNGAWGSVADRMDAYRSAGMFFSALGKFNWQGMGKGAAAQKVQASAFPGKYEGRMGQAAELLKGKFDVGGIVPTGLSLVGNYTGQAEHMGILTNDQWANLSDVANTGGSGYTDNRVIYEKGAIVTADLREFQRVQRNEGIKKSMRSRGRTR